MFAQNEEAAQINFIDNWTFGVKGGLNISSMRGDVSSRNKPLTSFHVGIVAELPLMYQLSAGVEPHLSIEGQKTGDGIERVSFLNIPMLVKYYAAENVSIEAGFGMAIKLAEKAEFDDGDVVESKRFKRLAPGATFGATYNQNRHWFAQFRFNFKFSDVIRKDGGDSEGTHIIILQLAVGYKFSKK